ncbi:serine/threonine protein kinase [Salinithrix halophila]|uniref:Serine/threonine protein kinase n=1 Tax=Salinithrix halophila TaxID=1485204 RepID=A0ABV8JIJ0_9BACL
MFWEPIKPLLSQVEISPKPDNQPVTVQFIPEGLEVVGTGTDAVVVRSPSLPQIVFKVYTEGRQEARDDEYDVYRKLGNSPYFPACYGVDDRFLVMSYEPGLTLYDCLVQGVVIPGTIIEEVEEARRYVRKIGLNPRDIHLKNVLLQDGRAKLLDVSEYGKPGDDGRWDHLVQGYRMFYPYLEGRRIPMWLIERVKGAYYDQVKGEFSLAEFGRTFLQFFQPGKR